MVVVPLFSLAKKAGKTALADPVAAVMDLRQQTKSSSQGAN
jgi:hypothetical protein